MLTYETLKDVGRGVLQHDFHPNWDLLCHVSHWVMSEPLLLALGVALGEDVVRDLAGDARTHAPFGALVMSLITRAGDWMAVVPEEEHRLLDVILFRGRVGFYVSEALSKDIYTIWQHTATAIAVVEGGGTFDVERRRVFDVHGLPVVHSSRADVELFYDGEFREMVRKAVEFFKKYQDDFWFQSWWPIPPYEVAVLVYIVGFLYVLQRIVRESGRRPALLGWTAYIPWSRAKWDKMEIPITDVDANVEVPVWMALSEYVGLKPVRELLEGSDV